MGRRKAEAEDNGTAEVKKKGKAKQEDLPGVEVSSRKIQELEDLADVVVEAEEAHKRTKGELDDAQENLAAAMRRRNRTYYNRPTYGTITLKEPKIRAAVKKGQHGVDEDSDEDAEFRDKVVETLQDAGADVELATV